MKQIISIAMIGLFLLFTKESQSQTAKDFFFPSNGLNVATFHEAAFKEKMVTRKIIYNVKEGNYEIIDIAFIQNVETSSSEKKLKINATEIYELSSFNTSTIMRDSKEVFNPPSLLFKLPLKGKSVTWNAIKNGDKVIKTAIYTTVNIEGQSKVAIKVSERPENKEYADLKSNSYYVLGMGLWKTEFEGSDGRIKVMDIQDELIKENLSLNNKRLIQNNIRIDTTGQNVWVASNYTCNNPYSAGREAVKFTFGKKNIYTEDGTGFKIYYINSVSTNNWGSTIFSTQSQKGNIFVIKIMISNHGDTVIQSTSNNIVINYFK